MRKDLIMVFAIGILALLLVAIPQCYAVEETVFTDSGSGPKTTEVFHIDDNEWKIKYSYEPTRDNHSFSLWIYEEGEDEAFAQWFIPGESGTLVVDRGPGDFYIDVKAFGIESWEIEII